MLSAKCLPFCSGPNVLTWAGTPLHQGCIQVSDFKGEIPLNISEKGGSVHWDGGIQYKCHIRFCQIWGDLPPLSPKFWGKVGNLGGIPPSLALDTTLLHTHTPPKQYAKQYYVHISKA